MIGALKKYYRRARHGWARSDAWSFDHYLAGVIAGGVAEIRQQGHGWPNGDPETGEDVSYQEWHRILTHIEVGFRHYAEHEEWMNPQVQLAMTLFAKWFPHLWD